MDLDSVRHDLTAVRHFLRRLKDEEHGDPVVPPLPAARVDNVPGRGEMFSRQAEGRDGGPTIVLLHGWALSADLNWFGGIYDVAARHGPVLAPDLRGHGRGQRSDKRFTLHGDHANGEPEWHAGRGREPHGGGRSGLTERQRAQLAEVRQQGGVGQPVAQQPQRR